MEHLLNEIEKAIECELYHIALVSSLALPDICSALESKNGRATRKKYEDWYNKYAKIRASSFLSADDCYLLRCSMIHQAKTVPSPQGKQTATYSRIIFTLPNPLQITFHNNIFGDALNLDVKEFCFGMIEAVRVWEKKMKDELNQNYIMNFRSLAGLYSDGLSPYIGGIPIEVLT